ncbi:hypothetical protein LTR99_008542 [Exophiala xenobiotica]|uniref:Uncharacterized protein n=1 Tax=Vermiconidia calcicola TaxID=1690605 RepID=A0AAV9Q0P6_9PEZI|nr:hypothetical protein LTR92_008310 [Exophiala xenobiotica]KAK5532932.1 hypothetical protein LTR25_007636 [Vermiconidia calcicola]KAK5546662.1 hypothetical protein LTR23_003409 [Chaetothyriales sp. CCFEE 6169]KAK5269994.1 hypothetical protein LTR96_004494 [Exophiala xenobiotica]KAK5296901.1 hypothetical protein LTR99_008542 [Exophiala xenobiotica]
MISSRLVLLVSTLIAFASSQTVSSGDGYTGYSLSVSGDGESAVYETDNTDTSNGAATTPPDVFLNASVSVGEIDITVSNLTAKINLDAQVLSLLQFNAGVDLSINRVALTIQNVSARVELEARLENLVIMINDTLNSIDLNPILATLGQDVGTLVNDTLSTATSSTSDLSARGFDLDQGILFSVNNYQGNTHKNRILDQAGNIVDQSLHNDGQVYQSEIVGSYWHDMTFTGIEKSVVLNGENVRELEYSYTPYNGLSIIAAIFLDTQSNVVGTRVLSELEGGGSSTISDD